MPLAAQQVADQVRIRKLQKLAKRCFFGFRCLSVIGLQIPGEELVKFAHSSFALPP